ncbi:BTB/POZ domain-containing protein 6-like [Dermacentor andersoni]|uniref:BTB/POZ domain-containing protein 6-like n=1 Tax=Dermacentor andersoni TaxID=34620 RepID=UPI0021558ACA|nr:BTB/POZ domain-containing protein 6-like [Dermacentor andersoni]
MDGYCYHCNTWTKSGIRFREKYCREVPTQTDQAGSKVSLCRSLESGDLADVEFYVECAHFPGQRETFKAHKMILALQSDVFKAMFYGDFANEDRIVITDLHPEGVRGLLRYFYSGHLDVANVHQAACTRTAASKYLVPELAEKCTEFVRRCMRLDDVCPLLDYVLTMGENDLHAPAGDLILKQSADVLSSSKFKSSTEATVKYVLEHVANVSEVSVLNAVYAWTYQQCYKRSSGNGIPVNAFRSVMMPLFPQLRFLVLTATEFVEGPNTWGILTDAEARAILSNIVKDRSMPMSKGFCEIRAPRVVKMKSSQKNTSQIRAVLFSS